MTFVSGLGLAMAPFHLPLRFLLPHAYMAVAGLAVGLVALHYCMKGFSNPWSRRAVLTIGAGMLGAGIWGFFYPGYGGLLAQYIEPESLMVLLEGGVACLLLGLELEATPQEQEMLSRSPVAQPVYARVGRGARAITGLRGNRRRRTHTPIARAIKLSA